VDPVGLWPSLSIGIPGTDVSISVGLPDPRNLIGEGEDAAADIASASNAALPYIHRYSGYATLLFSGCALVTSETVIGGLTCGGLALIAGGITAASSGALYVEHRESGTVLALDLSALGLSGVASALESSASAAARLGATDRALAESQLLRASAAPLYARPGLWASAQLLKAKAELWDVLASGLAASARGAAGISIGLGIQADRKDREALACNT
jgi:hypothetical protein